MVYARPPLRSARRTAGGYRKTPLLLAAASLVLTTGCGSGDGSAPQAAGTPKQGGQLTVLLPGEARGLDPFSASYINVTDGNRMAALYDMLVWTNPATGTVQPQLAEHLAPVDPAAKTWLLTLRPDINFTDGAPFDAAAVKTNWDRHAKPETASEQLTALLGVTTEVQDPLHLKITLPQSNANFDRTVAKHLTFIASPKAIAGGKLSEEPVGAGPFVLRPGGWVKNRTLTLERNPRYWKAGAPYLDKVVFKVGPNPAESVGAIKSGEADATVTVDPLIAAAAQREGLGREVLPLSGGQMLSFNTAKGPFADADARRAVAFALDGAAINQQVFQGAGTVARGVFAASSPLANVQLTAPDNNPEEAARLFAKATANGAKPLTAALIIPNTPASVKIAEYVLATLNRYPGVKLTVEALDLPSFIHRSNVERRFDVKVDQIWLDDPEPRLYGFLSGGDPGNCCFYNNAQVNEALVKARTATDTATRRDAYTQVQLALNRDMPFWVYQEAIAVGLFSVKVTGVQMFNDGVFLFDRIGMKR